MKILHVVGARPNFIKLVPVYRAIAHTEAKQIIVHTGQHYDYEMSEIFFEIFELPLPDYNLDVGSDLSATQVGKMLIALEPVISTEKPDVVVVYGDTNSSLAGAYVASKLCIPIAHVEAGCRNYDLNMPEEVNRVAIDHMSTYNFCATRKSCQILNFERYGRGAEFVGDVMLDLHLALSGLVSSRSRALEGLSVSEGKYVLATIHRPRNTDDLKRLCDIFGALANHTEPVVVPIHPRTLKQLNLAELSYFGSIVLLRPQGYLDFMRLLMGARVVVTDSGGVQKEAYFTSVPCITVFPHTAWKETLFEGWNRLVEPVDIPAALKSVSRPSGQQPLFFGDGSASRRIADRLSI